MYAILINLDHRGFSERLANHIFGRRGKQGDANQTSLVSSAVVLAAKVFYIRFCTQRWSGIFLIRTVIFNGVKTFITGRLLSCFGLKCCRCYINSVPQCVFLLQSSLYCHLDKICDWSPSRFRSLQQTMVCCIKITYDFFHRSHQYIFLLCGWRLRLGGAFIYIVRLWAAYRIQWL